MPLTLEELFQRGAHHTVESLFETGDIGTQSIVDAINRRFGEGSAVRGDVVNELINQVNYSKQESYRIPSVTNPNPASYGVNPAIPLEYQYPVIATLIDPLKPGEPIQVPWSINSDKPLTYQEILNQAEKDLNEGYVRPDNYNSAIYADLHRRDIKWQETVKRQYGSDAPIDIEVIGAYRRG